MSYDTPSRHAYSIQAAPFSTGTTRTIRGPKGKRGRVANVDVAVTTTMAGTTSTPRVQVGTAGTPTAYFDADLGTTAAGASWDAEQVDTAAKNVFKKDAQNAKALLPADTDVQITCAAGVGTPAGVGDVLVHIDWF